MSEEQDIRDLQAEIERLQVGVRAIAAYGKAHPGFGFSCGAMAEDLLKETGDGS